MTHALLCVLRDLWRSRPAWPWYIILLNCNYEMLRLILNLLRQKPAQPPPEALAWSLFYSVSFSLETCSYGYLLVFQVPRVERVCAVSESGMPTYNILNYDNQRLLDVHFTCPLRAPFGICPLLIQIGCNVYVGMGPSLDRPIVDHVQASAWLGRLSPDWAGTVCRETLRNVVLGVDSTSEGSLSDICRTL